MLSLPVPYIHGGIGTDVMESNQCVCTIVWYNMSAFVFAFCFPSQSSLSREWSDPRILFVLGLHKHLFVFVRVIQFVCGPRIMLCAHTNLVRDSIFSGGRPIFSISHSDFRPAKYTRKSTPRPIPSPRHPPPAGSPHQCDATLTTHPPSFPCPSSREEGVGKIYTRPL